MEQNVDQVITIIERLSIIVERMNSQESQSSAVAEQRQAVTLKLLGIVKRQANLLAGKLREEKEEKEEKEGKEDEQ